MTEGKVLVSGGEASENGEFLFKRLPPWMPATEGDGNFKLLDVVGREFDQLDGEIHEVNKETTVQKSSRIANIREIARLVGELPKQDETLEEYRIRVIASFQKVTCEGTLEDIFNNFSILLNISPEKMTYEDLEANGEILIGIPGNAIDDVALSREKFAEVIENQPAAGFRIDVKSLGTMTFVGSDEYTGSGTFDPADLESDSARGFDGLDANGDPKNNGGTYAGILNN